MREGAEVEQSEVAKHEGAEGMVVGKGLGHVETKLKL